MQFRFNHPRRAVLNLTVAALALMGTGVSSASAATKPVVAAPVPVEAGRLVAPTPAPRPAASPAPTPVAAPAPEPEPTASLPLERGSYRLSARFGATGSWSRYHTGLDFAADVGTPVHAVVAGTVVEPTAGGWAGTHLIIRAADGSHTLYAHLSDADVAPGDTVTVGQQIGEVGETGRSFGAHLHLEYYEPGTTPGDIYTASDPGALLRANGITHW